MKRVGEIKAIINEDHLVFSSGENLSRGDKLTVYSLVKNTKFSDLLGTDKLLFPTGEIRIICEQKVGLYLAERFRETEEHRRTITTPSPLVKAFSWYSGETKEIIEEIPGAWSADFDSEKSLGIDIPKVVTVGDIVGRM